MFLILAESSDLTALWVYRQFRNRGVNSVEFVESEILSCSLRWEHRISSSGSTIKFQLADGRKVDGQAVRAVLNRLTSVSFRHLFPADARDREFAQAELTAFFTSWLYSLQCPVLNSVSPQGLSGRLLSSVQWHSLAMKAKLPVDTFVQRSDLDSVTPDQQWGTKPVIVIGNVVLGNGMSSKLSDACLRLSRLAEMPLLGIQFALDKKGLCRFESATPHPDFRIGGDQAIDALLRVFLQ